MLTIALCAAMLACPAALAEGVTAETGQVKAAIVTEAQSGQRIFEKNAEERLNLGGLVRLPALLYALEYMDSGKLAADENIVVSPEAASVGGATAFLKAGETIKAGTAMKAAVMITAGDATFALAEACAGGQDAAVKAINELMQDAGVYTEVSSIDGKGLMLSAEELAKLGARLAKSGTYKQYSALYLDEIQHENGTRTELVNQNKLIKSLDGCFAGSTGSSSEAQYCGVFMVKRKGAVFIAAVIGAADSKTRFSCASKTIEASAAAVSIKTPVKKGDKVVENGSTVEIFNHPKSEVARELLRKDDGGDTTGDDQQTASQIQDGTKIRIVFTENSAFEPVIANMILTFKEPINILKAATKNVGGVAKGEMILEIPNGSTNVKAMEQYLIDRGLEIEELSETKTGGAF